jgi:hypothetical protein
LRESLSNNNPLERLFSKGLLLLAFSFLIICSLIGAQGGETPTGRAVRWRLLMAQSGRRLTARPVESEQPGAEINYFQKATMYAKTAFRKETKKKAAFLYRNTAFIFS